MISSTEWWAEMKARDERREKIKLSKSIFEKEKFQRKLLLCDRRKLEVLVKRDKNIKKLLETKYEELAKLKLGIFKGR